MVGPIRAVAPGWSTLIRTIQCSPAAGAGVGVSAASGTGTCQFPAAICRLSLATTLPSVRVTTAVTVVRAAVVTIGTVTPRNGPALMVVV